MVEEIGLKRQTVPFEVGSVLKILFEEGQKKPSCSVTYQRLLQEFASETDEREAMLVATLAVLRGMGLIEVGMHGEVKAISRQACFALGSLGKFMSASVPVVEGHIDPQERDYLRKLTGALESMRVENVRVDNEPIHHRRIVNILVKSRQVRCWRMQDVYLHIYHPQWKEYHLVGLSHKDGSKTDEEIAKLALEKQVGLMPYQFHLDRDFNPPEAVVRCISATSGAFTEYTFRLIAVKAVEGKLELRRLIEEDHRFDHDWFRWFTWKEIQNRRSEQGEPIMFSTPIIMEQVDLGSIPVSAPKADDVRPPIGALNELSCRLTRRQLFAFAGFLVALALLQFALRAATFLDRQSSVLDNLSNIADIVSAVLALATGVGVLLTLHSET
jgi:hypothetical protein